VKYFFYSFLLVASLGTAGAVLNPPLVQQCAALLGLELPQSTTDPAEKVSDEDRLSQFMAEYPFARKRDHSETIPVAAVPPVATPPAATIPLAVVPSPPSPPSPPLSPPSSFPPAFASPAGPPAYAMPAAPPVVEPEPAYSSNWDGAVSVPIAEPPITDWSGPSQSFHEPTPAPEQSIYATALSNAPHQSIADPFALAPVAQPPVVQPVDVQPVDAFSAIHIPQPHGFEQTNFSSPVAQPLLQPMHPQSPMHGTLQTPAVLIEAVPVHGTETVARVGTQVILMADILPKLRRAALKIIGEQFKQMPEEERAKVAPQEIEQVINAFIETHYPDFLQEQILCALVYSDYEASKSRAEKNMFQEKIGDEFDRVEVPEMMKEFNVDTTAALKKFLETRLGSSLERERHLWIKEQIVRHWIGLSVQRATGECTHDEMREFYEQNMAMFTSPARAQWQEMVVFFSGHNTEQEALNKIRWMGNQVAGGAPFEEIAKANSDGFTASKGGLWDWTTKGNLASAELEQAIFSQPVRQLSPAIIRSETGFHIIRVLDRQEVTVVPLLEAQGTIREKIRNQRIQRYQAEYFADLRSRHPMQIVKGHIDFNASNPRATVR